MIIRLLFLFYFFDNVLQQLLYYLKSEDLEMNVCFLAETKLLAIDMVGFILTYLIIIVFFDT